MMKTVQKVENYWFPPGVLTQRQFYTQPSCPGVRGHICRHPGLSQSKVCNWHLKGRNQGCRKTFHNAQNDPTTKNYADIIMTKMSAVPRAGNPG